MSVKTSELFEGVQASRSQDYVYDLFLDVFEDELINEAALARAVLDTSLSDADFSARYHKILDSQDNWLPLVYNPVQVKASNTITGFDIYLKPRQVGISTWVLSRIHKLLMTSTTRATVFLDKDDNTFNAREMMRRYHDNIPEGVIAPKRILDSGVRMSFDNGSLITLNTAGSKTSGRSSTNRVMFFDEAAYYRDLGSIMRGAMQAGSPEWVAIASTANGAQGLFYELCMKAFKTPHLSKWTLHFFEWWLEPRYAIPLEDGESLTYTDVELALMKKHAVTAEQIKWRRDKISEFNGDEAAFLQEYPEDPMTCFLTSGNAFFILKPDTFSAPTNAVYDPTHIYMAGVDWGRDKDYTVCCVIDITANEQVELYRNRHTDYNLMMDDIADLMAKWHVSVCMPEINSAEMGMTDFRNKVYAQSPDTIVRTFRTLAINKMPMLNGLNRAITDGLKLLDIREQEAAFRSVLKKQNANNMWVAEDETNHTPDEVMAAGLAVRAASSYIGDI